MPVQSPDTLLTLLVIFKKKNHVIMQYWNGICLVFVTDVLNSKDDDLISAKKKTTKNKQKKTNVRPVFAAVRLYSVKNVINGVDKVS